MRPHITWSEVPWHAWALKATYSPRWITFSALLLFCHGRKLYISHWLVGQQASSAVALQFPFVQRASLNGDEIVLSTRACIFASYDGTSVPV